MMRAIAVHGARWGGRLPFTIITCLTLGSRPMQACYLNKDKDSTWNKVRSASKIMRKRELETQTGPGGEKRDQHFLKQIREEIIHNADSTIAAGWVKTRKEYFDKNAKYDISPYGQNYLVVDPSNFKGISGDRRPMTMLVNEIVRFLAAALPALAIKTGGALKTGTVEYSNESGAEVAVEQQAAGIPVLFLDLLERPRLSEEIDKVTGTEKLAEVEARLKRLSMADTDRGNLAEDGQLENSAWLAPERRTLWAYSFFFKATQDGQRANGGAEKEFREGLAAWKEFHEGLAAWKEMDAQAKQPFEAQAVKALAELERERLEKEKARIQGVRDNRDLQRFFSKTKDGSSLTGRHLSSSPPKSGAKVMPDFDEASETKVRGALIDWVVDSLKNERAKNPDMPDICDMCELAWIHDALFDDADSYSVASLTKNQRREHLYMAIARKQDYRGASGSARSGLKPATPDQIEKTAQWLAEFVVESSLRIDMPQDLNAKIFIERNVEKARKGGDFQRIVSATKTRLIALMNSPRVHAVNVCAEEKQIDHLVQSLVRLDRLPPETNLEGLLLLKQAWNEHDIAMHLAGRYKISAKGLFLLQLIVSWVIVALSSLFPTAPATAEASNGSETAGAGAAVTSGAGIEGVDYGAVGHAVFGLTVAASFLISFEAFVNAKARWRQLRTCAGSLKSITWAYRTRVAPFEPDRLRFDALAPETALRQALLDWRDELAAGADMNTTLFQKKHPSGIFKHFQNRPEPGSRGGQPRGPPGTDEAWDDHFSPVPASDYIKLRLEPTVAFYRQRLPWRSRQRTFLKLLLLGTTVAAAVLARQNFSTYVTIVTAFAAVVTSYSEFADNSRKMERYTRAIVAVKSLLTWWHSISPVEKASKLSVNHLILTGESILAEERLGWQATAARPKGGNGGGSGEDERARQQKEGLHGGEGGDSGSLGGSGGGGGR